MTHCLGCDQPIEAGETTVYGDEGAYHMGCEFAELHAEVGSGRFDRCRVDVDPISVVTPFTPVRPRRVPMSIDVLTGYVEDQ